MAKMKQGEDRRPGMDILRELLDAPTDDPVCSVDGAPSPADAVADILAEACPPGTVVCQQYKDCRKCWYRWLTEGA